MAEWWKVVDAEMACADGNENMITWGIRQFMDNKKTTEDWMYKHVAERKEAAVHV